MKTKHYDGEMIKTIKKVVENANYESHITGNEYELEVINIVDCEHTGIAHVEKCINMNLSLFNEAGGKIALVFDSNWMNKKSKLSKLVSIVPMEIVDEFD